METLTIFAKYSIFDIWQGSKYAYVHNIIRMTALGFGFQYHCKNRWSYLLEKQIVKCKFFDLPANIYLLKEKNLWWHFFTKNLTIFTRETDHSYLTKSKIRVSYIHFLSKTFFMIKCLCLFSRDEISSWYWYQEVYTCKPEVYLEFSRTSTMNLFYENN